MMLGTTPIAAEPLSTVPTLSSIVLGTLGALRARVVRHAPRLSAVIVCAASDRTPPQPYASRPTMFDRLSIPLNTDLELLVDLTATDSATVLPVAATGQTVTMLISATRTGATIHSSLSVTMTEVADGRYRGIIEGADIGTNLASYLGRVVYVRILANTTDLTAAADCVVTDTGDLT